MTTVSMYVYVLCMTNLILWKPESTVYTYNITYKGLLAYSSSLNTVFILV
jgi:hypothetical protein